MICSSGYLTITIVLDLNVDWILTSYHFNLKFINEDIHQLLSVRSKGELKVFRTAGHSLTRCAVGHFGIPSTKPSEISGGLQGYILITPD